MKLIVQRATRAAVRVFNPETNDWTTTGEFSDGGLAVLVGIEQTDTRLDAKYACSKLVNLRLFEDNGRSWSKSVAQMPNHSIILVSQFTLHSVLKGNSPDFHMALDGKYSNALFDEFVEMVKQEMTRQGATGTVTTGKFGAKMSYEITNDGPVTIEINSRVMKPAEGASQLARLGGEKGSIREIKRVCTERGIEIPDYAQQIALARGC